MKHTHTHIHRYLYTYWIRKDKRKIQEPSAKKTKTKNNEKQKPNLRNARKNSWHDAATLSPPRHRSPQVPPSQRHKSPQILTTSPRRSDASWGVGATSPNAEGAAHTRDAPPVLNAVDEDDDVTQLEIQTLDEVVFLSGVYSLTVTRCSNVTGIDTEMARLQVTPRRGQANKSAPRGASLLTPEYQKSAHTQTREATVHKPLRNRGRKDTRVRTF